MAQDSADAKAEVTITQSDVSVIKNEFPQIRDELREIRQRLDALETSIHSVTGFAKEIDHLLERVGAIEQHLGIRDKIAA